MRFILNITLIIIIFMHAPLSSALSNDDYKSYLQVWDQKIKLASEYLKDAEEELKNGNEAIACKKQREAAKYGIEATESLIKAFKISGSTNDLSDLRVGINKWEELRDFC